MKKITPLLWTPLLLACAQQQEAGIDQARSATAQDEECFYMSQVSGFNDAPDGATGSDRIYVHAGPDDTYLFETFGSCPDLNFSETIAFDQNGPGRICRGIDVDLLVPTAIGLQRCPVAMISKVEESDR